MKDPGTALTVFLLVSGAFILILLVVTEHAKRLRVHVDNAFEVVRLELRREMAEQEVQRARIVSRIRDLEKDLLELVRARANDANRIDAAVKNFVEAMAALEKEKKARARRRAARLRANRDAG